MCDSLVREGEVAAGGYWLIDKGYWLLVDWWKETDWAVDCRRDEIVKRYAS